MTTTIYRGGVSPEAVEFDIGPGASGLDMTTVTGASFDVKQPDGTMAVWAGAILAGATPTLLRVQHVLSAPDTAQIGKYALVARLVVPSGVRRAGPLVFAVVDPFVAC